MLALGLLRSYSFMPSSDQRPGARNTAGAFFFSHMVCGSQESGRRVSTAKTAEIPPRIYFVSISGGYLRVFGGEFLSHPLI